MTRERILRAVALLVAALAFIDPALTRAQQKRPTVVVLHASPSDLTLASDVATALDSTFEVSRADLPGAAAYVVAGADLPEGWRPPADARLFAVIPAAASLGLKVLNVTAPSEVSLDSIAPLAVDLQVDGTGEREVTVALIASGVRLNQVVHRVTGADTRVRVPLTFVPFQAGLVRLRIQAAMLGRESAVTDRMIAVNARIWTVLAFDGRPTYSATFVRRALESDPRFKVMTRVVTSRASSIETDAAPSTLANPSALAAFDLIIVGAPDAFGEQEAGSLQRYMRERDGAVILLPETIEGALLSRLSGEGTWQDDRRLKPVPVSPLLASPGGGAGWAASEFVWPARWPPLTEPLATIPHRPIPRPAVWQLPRGGGRLAVSSATDGWRSRAGAASGFSAFWRATAASLSQATPQLVDVTMPRRLLTPGQWAEVSVGMFSRGEPIARVISASTDSSVRLWPVDAAPSGTGSEWRGAFRAPDLPGRYRMNVTAGAGATGFAEFAVVEDDGVDSPLEPALERNGLSALAASAHRGSVVAADQIEGLAAQISSVVTSSQAREEWRPMHSVWWLIPFTLCASGEWWLRRHRGGR